ncbi:hypothetical protein R0L51_004272 [Salmonella enterica subsp. enterica serovar Poona]|nr:hypothetical protein [Salmonella enterica]EEG4330549.1 hypothetical protein [Salmonella enterica subsp. enterica]ELO2166081.1 hypothetical protein [Salmonella enterica subsp. enterica serovar Poona]ELV9047992.1 hypothetical protein [Salmonella enterica subsp. enterica serovar Johannesburg]HEC8007580.1 hypothetical protein [Salmonella enterica subsp. enterica serovar Johannesburg]
MSSLENIEASLSFLCRELGVNYERNINTFKILDPITNLEIETSFSDEKEIKEMLQGLRGILISLYKLIDQDPIIFQGSATIQDPLANYAYEPSILIFKGILPVKTHSE